MATFKQSFCEAEEAAMRFLVDEFGFLRVERSITDGGSCWTGGDVRYEAQGESAQGPPRGWTVSLAIAPFRLELDLQVSDGLGPDYSVAELHQLEGSGAFPRREQDMHKAARTPDVQREMFECLASVLRTAGRRFFAGDVGLWAELKAQRRQMAQAEEDTRILADSERAFQAKDFALVVSLLEPIASRLSKVAAARLSYSKKRLHDTT